MKIGDFGQRLAGLRTALTLSACAGVPHGGADPQPGRDRQLTRRSRASPRRAADWPSDRWWDAYGDAQLSGLDRRGAEGLADPRAGRGAAGLGQRRDQRRPRRHCCPASTAARHVAETEQSRIEGFPPFIQQLLPQGLPGQRPAGAGPLVRPRPVRQEPRGAGRARCRRPQATRADLAEARLTLSTAIAGAYADLMRLGAERDAAAEAVRNRAETAKLTPMRVENGLDTRAELKQAEAADAGLAGRRRGARRADPAHPPPHRRAAGRGARPRPCDRRADRRGGEAVRPAGRPAAAPGGAPPRHRRRPAARRGSRQAHRRRLRAVLPGRHR